MAERWAGRAGLVVVVALVGAVVLAARDVVLAMSSNADFVAPLVMGRRAASFPGSLLVTGNYGWFNGLWVTQGLSRLPGAATVSNYLPLGVSVATALGLGAAARSLWGALAGTVAAAVPLAVGAGELVTLASFSARAPTWWTMAAVLLVVVWGLRGPTGPTRVAWALVAAGVAVAAGATLAGDALAWAVVAVPLAAVVAERAASRAWRPALGPLVLLVAMVVARFVVGALAGDAGYRFTGAPTPLAPLRAAESGSANAVLGLQQLWRGDGPAGLETLRGLLGLLLVLAAVAAGVVLLAGASRQPSGPEAAARCDGVRLARRAWVAFWLTVVAAALGAFAVTTVSGPLGEPVVRYLQAVPFATGALLAAACTGRGRLLAVPALALGLWAAVALTVHRPPEDPARHRPAIGPVTAAVQRYDLDVGYASYWTAYPLEHATDLRYPVLPVVPCRAGAPALCRPFLHYVSGAYAPRPGVRSFLLVDTSATALDGDPGTYVTRVPPGPAPERTVDVGDGLTLLVYPFDLAGTLGASSATPERPS